MSSSSFFNLQLNISINIEELQGLKSYLNNITKNNNNPNEYSIKLHTLEIRLNEESKKNTKAQENTKKLISYDQIIYKILEDFTFISKFRENILKSYNQKKGKLIANYDQNKSYILQIYHNDDNDPLYSFEIIENKEPKQASIQYLYANYVKFLKEKILSILKKFTNESDSILISNLDELYKELGGQDIPNNVEDKKNYSGQIENNIKNIPQKKTKIIKISEPGIDDEGRTNVSFEIDQSNSHKQKSKEINNIENDSQHRTNHKSFGISKISY